MVHSREGVNPLRPYYIPPTIGEPADNGPGPSSGSPSNYGNAASSRYASKARDMFNDLEYNGYMGDSESSTAQTVKKLVDELMWKYTSVLMAQPFEVAKMILQVRSQDEVAAVAPSQPSSGLQKRSTGGSIYDYHDSDSDGDEPAYFTSNAPVTPTRSYVRSPDGLQLDSPSNKSRASKKPVSSEAYLTIRRSDSVIEAISAVWQKEGAWGVWKGSNARFLYTVLQSLLENWSRSFLSAIFNVPDLGVQQDMSKLVDIASPYPWTSIFVAGTAAVATGLILSPLDLVRTRLIMTPVTRGQRRTMATLRALPSYVCSSLTMLPTALNSLIHPLLNFTTPLVLRTSFMIDSKASPMTYSVAKFFASSVAILIKLPVETILRRGQMTLLSQPEYVRALDGKDNTLETIVTAGQYRGILGTMYHITTEEGTREVPAKSTTARKGKGKAKNLSLPAQKKGQGLEGLWRGWKVSWWGLVGLWTASAVGNGGEGEF